MTIAGFVQAGGESRRMGQNKALMMLAEHQLIEYPLALLAEFAAQRAIITNRRQDYAHLAIDCYPDRWPGLGPLGGIGSALMHSEHDFALILACDMPLVRAPLISLLLAESNGYDICLPQSKDGLLQPLCALYHRNCLSEIEQLIAAGEYAPRALFRARPTRIVPFSQFSHLPGAADYFENLNTPEDFLSAQAKLIAPPN